MVNMGNMGNLMKQAQMMQERVAKVQEEIAALECTGEAGAGLVKVTLNGRHEVRRVEIDPSLFGPDGDKEMGEDLIAAACNDANRRLEAESKAKMESVTAGIPLPPGMKLPF